MPSIRSFLFALCVVSTSIQAHGRSVAPPPDAEPRPVDLVIALDVSSSMSGLIDSAKQRLWDIVNELGRAQPQPDLRIAIISFGNPGYGPETGYVRVDQPFTRDLDAVNETLFGFGTNGGEEYVARAVHASLEQLQWTPRRDGLRIVFVAGNESARQDPQYSLEQVIGAALERDVVVNALFCGHDQDSAAVSWQEVSHLSGGFYARIDQNAAAVAQIATPMDKELLSLNQSLNATYVAYGREGSRKRDNQLRQDANAAEMSAPAAASRVVAKAGALYDSSDWDLVEAVREGAELEEIETEDLPEAMKPMSQTERKAYLEEKANERNDLEQRIAQLDAERRQFIEQRRAEMAGESDSGLDAALLQGIREIAEARGFAFASTP